MRYGYMYNQDGEDLLNVNVFEPDYDRADLVGELTNFNSDPGVPLLIKQPTEFIKLIMDLPELITIDKNTFEIGHQYFGYYFDEATKQYVLDVDAIKLTEADAYQILSKKLIQLKQIKPNEINNQIVDGQLHDAQNVVINHEGGVISVSNHELKSLKNRLQEVLE